MMKNYDQSVEISHNLNRQYISMQIYMQKYMQI